MPFLLAEILNFQGSTHLIGVGSLSNKLANIILHFYMKSQYDLVQIIWMQ